VKGHGSAVPLRAANNVGFSPGGKPTFTFLVHYDIAS
jgi:hypothetical protein